MPFFLLAEDDAPRSRYRQSHTRRCADADARTRRHAAISRGHEQQGELGDVSCKAGRYSDARICKSIATWVFEYCRRAVGAISRHATPRQSPDVMLPHAIDASAIIQARRLRLPDDTPRSISPALPGRSPAI